MGIRKSLDSVLFLCLEELLELFLDILIFLLAYEVGLLLLAPCEGMAMGLVLCKETVAEITPGSLAEVPRAGVKCGLSQHKWGGERGSLAPGP